MTIQTALESVGLPTTLSQIIGKILIFAPSNPLSVPHVYGGRVVGVAFSKDGKLTTISVEIGKYILVLSPVKDSDNLWSAELDTQPGIKIEGKFHIEED